jgi:hypothetical protein
MKSRDMQSSKSLWRLFLTFALVALFVGIFDQRISAVEWQFAVDVGPKNGRAFMWIPPTCQKVRGVILGQQVILEKVALEDPHIREAAARECLATVLIIPSIFKDFDEAGKGGETLQAVLNQVAEASGYSEIARAPILPIGHSGGAIPAWNLCYWNPQRCFGLVAVKAAPIHPPIYSPKANVDGVPILDVSGQYESWGNPAGFTAEYHWRWVRGSLLEFRAIGARSLMSELVEPGVTHFGWGPELAEYVALFIQKAAHYRIPIDTPIEEIPKLIEISLADGWLTDITLMDRPNFRAAQFSEFKGDKLLAFWHLDEELAKANEAFGKNNRNKKLQMLSFVEDDKVLPSQWLEELKFRPVSDGMTIKVRAEYLAETPPEMSFPKKLKLSHSPGKIKYRLIGGWSGGGEQISDDTFRIRFDRFGITKPSGTIMVMAYNEGDKDFAYAEQAVQIKFPVKNTAGIPQRIAFEPIPDRLFSTKPVFLKAVSDAGLPVEFCVVAGPAEINENVLTLTTIPSKTKFPVKLTVAAYQWGRFDGKMVQSAEPVLQSFLITGN